MNANYRAAKRARTTREFIAKLGIVIEEADESLEWLMLLSQTHISHSQTLLDEAEQLLRIFKASQNTAKRNFNNRTDS